MTKLHIELKGFDDLVRTLDPKIVERATVASLNRTVQSGRTAASNEIRSTWNVKKRDLDPRITLSLARMGQMKAELYISGKSISLSYFGARQITGTRVLTRSGKGIKSGRITRGMRAAGPVPVGVMVQVEMGKETALYRRAFLARMKSGHVGVMRRVSGKMMKSNPKKQAIEEKNVVSIATMVQRPAVMERLTRRLEERWAAEFPHQLDYYLDRAKR